MKVRPACFAALLLVPLYGAGTSASFADTASKAKAPPVDDVIARVGDQSITFSEISIALNSSGVVGVSIPALGSPERDTARIVVLDRFVSANLLYLDALKQGLDKDPAYRKTISRFSNAILSGLYRQRVQAGEISVTEEEVQDYYKQNVDPKTELTDHVRLQIESKLRRQKLHERLAQAERTLRDGVEVSVHTENLDVNGDGSRADDTPLAEVGGETITWGQVKNRIIAAGKAATTAEPTAFGDHARRNALESEIDIRIMVQKAKAMGMDAEPAYRKRLREYSKTLLINMHRERLAKQMEPSDEELKAYYEKNRDRFMVPEARQVQMVVVKTKEEAEELKGKIESGAMTMYQAARDHSIAARAKQDLGEVGWINKGDVVPALDEVIFDLGPGKIGGPVETPAGWHLVTVQDVKEAQYTDFDDETRKLTRRRYLHEKIDAYTAELRKNEIPVEVYLDRLVQLAQQEADAVKALAERAKQPGSVTEQRIKDLQKLMKPSGPVAGVGSP